MELIYDPSTSYMKDGFLRESLIAELSQIAEKHFSGRLQNLSARSIDYTSEVNDFMTVYSNRPYRFNTGGSGFHNAFWLFLVARKLNPTLIIESGVWKGHTTWLLEQSCPNAKIAGFDINLSRLEYKHGKAKFYGHDWSQFQFEDVDPEQSLIFFDCHVNHAKRIIESSKKGFRHLIFDDNPPANKLYTYGLPGFPTANMVWQKMTGPATSEISWCWQGKEISYRIDIDEIEEARNLMKMHEEFPDVGGPTRYGGFSFLTYVNCSSSMPNEYNRRQNA